MKKIALHEKKSIGMNRSVEAPFKSFRKKKSTNFSSYDYRLLLAVVVADSIRIENVARKTFERFICL